MRIGIEAQRIFRKKKHGMDIVGLELIRALQRVDLVNEYFIFVKKGEDNTCISETANFRIIEVPGLTYADWEQVFLPIYVSRYRLDVLHCTSNTAPILSSVPTIITLHDVIFLENKSKQGELSNFYQQLGRIYRRYIVPTCINQTRHIITVSNYEKDRIADTLGINGEKISVVYNAFGAHFKLNTDPGAIDQIKVKYNLPDSYIFYIGNTDPKKNMSNTLKAYASYVDKTETPLPLLVADVNQNNLDIIIDREELGKYRKHIRLTGYIYNTDLPLIYAGASLFLYPSLRESFGIPVLESMACGTPVITSNASALPEVAGDAAVLVDPRDQRAIAGAILDSLANMTLRETLIKKGLERISHFSWDSSAHDLINIYQAF